MGLVTDHALTAANQTEQHARPLCSAYAKAVQTESKPDVAQVSVFHSKGGKFLFCLFVEAAVRPKINDSLSDVWLNVDRTKTGLTH